MKKISIILAVVAITFSFVACNGTKKDAVDATEKLENSADSLKKEVINAADTLNAAVKATDTKVVDASLAAYEKYVDQIVPIIAKMKKGEANAAVEYSKVAKDALTITSDVEKNVANFTAEQKAKYEKLSKKYAEAVKSMTPK